MKRTQLLSAGFLLLALLCTALPAAAAPADYPFLQNLTNEDGTPWSYYLYSYGVAVNASGYIFVTQFYDERIDVFNSSFGHVETWYSPSPAGVAVNSTGYVFVANRASNKISILSPSSAEVGEISSAYVRQPWGVAVNTSDYLFITNDLRDNVQVFDKNSVHVAEFDDGFPNINARAIAVNSMDQIIVGSIYSPSLNVFDRDYRAVRSIDTGFSDVRGLAIDAADNIMVSGFDVAWTPFKVFSPTGTLIGTGSGMPLTLPFAIAVNRATGKVFVVDLNSHYVRIFSSPQPTPTPSGPSPSFAAYPQSGPAPHTVQFLDYTPNAQSWSWDFGDGRSSTLQYPMHTYTAPGLYTVSLTVTTWAGQTSTKTEYHYIRVTEPVTPAPTPVANFTANTTTGSAPLAVQFTDASSPAPYHRWWQFGDGATSTDANPVHTYERTGAYTVNLTVWTPIGQATVSKPTYVIVDGDPRVPEANFTLSRTSGPAPLYVRFTDTSTGTPTSWRWDFGGLAWTTMRNPSVVFRQPGVYTVTLTVRNPYGWSSMGTNVTVTGGARSTGGRAVSVVG